MKKCPWLTIFANINGKYIVPNVSFSSHLDMCKALSAGLTRILKNDVIFIEREEEGTEKMVLYFNGKDKSFEVHSTVDKVNTIYVFSEIIKNLMQKNVKDVELTFIVENKDAYIINHDSIDIGSICEVIANAINKTTEHFFSAKSEESKINVKINRDGVPFVLSTVDQETTLKILVDILFDTIKTL